MPKLIVFVRRKAGTTPEAFRAHYESTHAPLAMANMTGLSRYVRNYPQAMPGQPAPEHDCITEMWFESADALATTMAWMRSEDAKIIAADEDLFMDRSSMTAILVDEMIS